MTGGVAEGGYGASRTARQHDERVPSGGWTWTLYTFLLFARVVASPFLPGYVHPDEFFQGGQELWFGCPPAMPWEFEPDHALRSVLPPTLMTWTPLRAYAWLSSRSMSALSGIEVLVVPRVACALLSIFTVDWSLWRVCNRSGTAKTTTGVPVPLPVLLLASAWPTFVMLARPFSNSLESFVLALLFCSVVCDRPSSVGEEPSSKRPAVFAFQVGALSALGIFTRFTFAFYAFPVLLYLLLDMVQVLGLGRRLARNVVMMAASFSLVAFGIVLADTHFYASRRAQDGSSMMNNDSPGSSFIAQFSARSLVLTPYNALAYNSQVSNLEDHGLHPRWTHAAVNMFILYGPLTLAGYLLILSSSSSGPFRFPFSNAPDSSSGRNDGQEMVGSNCVVGLAQAVVLSGLAFLSVAPHQEPRFLLPLMFPLVLMGSRVAQSRVMAYLWVLFNLVLLVLFGLLHQAGVTLSLLTVGSRTVSETDQPVAWVYLRTYMPPTFLTRGATNYGAESDFGTLGSSCRKGFRGIDLNGAGMGILSDTLASELDCTSDGGYASGRHVQLFVPTLTAMDEDGSIYSFGASGTCRLPGDLYTCTLAYSSGPHLTTEDLPSWKAPLSEYLREFAVHTYEISCK
jgi:phosphatidylinositol glycan class Z